MHQVRHFLLALAWLAFSAFAAASPYRGVVTFGGLPLPGATITATQGGKTLTAVSDQNGAFAFDDLHDGKWAITVQMQCFESIHADLTVAPNLPAAAWEMKLLPMNQLEASAQKTKPAMELPPVPALAQEKKPEAAAGPAEIPKAPEENEQSADGLLVQGSVNNASTSVYSTNSAFGNRRPGSRALYTGGIAAFIENSALDARPYSLAGSEAGKPAYNDFTGVATLQGPIRIPHLMPVGPNFFASYQWTRNSTSQILSGIVPTQDERNGTVPGFSNQFTVSPQAAALLQYYPLPNLANGSQYNYQTPALTSSHQDAPQFRLDKTLSRKDEVYGRFSLQSTRADNVNLFGFVDHTGTLGINTNIHWAHRLKPRVFVYTGYTFSRLRTEVTPYFEDRDNISGNAGITGNDQDPANWGPPSLSFSSGITGLGDTNSAFNRNRTDDFTASMAIYRSKHNITIGGEFRKQEYNVFSQENPRGTFTFNGTTGTGSDLANFLTGVPDASAIAYGNADKYFREPVYAAYVNDDWRVLPILSINWGIRWDYGAPMTELFGRLVNLDVASGFTSIAPVTGSNPVGSITGQHYPASLIRPDRSMIEPKIGISWRPIPASTVVIRAGYGIYPDTSVYQNIVLQMAQQAPLSKSVNGNNSVCPLTLANGFVPCSAVTSETFGIDPNFRIGYNQEWQLQVQRDLPFAMQMTATYLGIKGTHGPQEILPNSYPLGETNNPCPSCASGFVYETSGGNSFRNAGELQLRRRLRSGLAASLAYTYSRSIDDDAYLGGQGHTIASGGQTQSANLASPTSIYAQNWLDPQAERSLSSFDQRNLLSAQAQYTTGQGLEGGTLLNGWRGRAFKEWTVLGNLSFGSGLPETPLVSATLPGTAFINIVRPNLTGAPIYTSASNTHLNVAAYSEPKGQWGNAGRNSITGPDQFSFNSSLARTFRPHGKTYLDFALQSTNTFNHASFSSWNNNIGNSNVPNSLFGTPVSPNAMRSLQISMHLRFQ
jgi:trimeric autotransporter adhesin